MASVFDTTNSNELSPATPGSTPLPVPLCVYLGIMLVFGLLSGAVAAYEIAHSPFHEISSLPHRFDDFMIYWHRLPLLHTKSFYSAPDGEKFGSQWGYPAPAIWAYRFFYLFDPEDSLHPVHGFAVLEAVIFVGILTAGAFFFRALRNHGLRPLSASALATVAALCSWPFLFAVQRGNIELLLWLPLVAALWAFRRGLFSFAAVLIGVTAAAKIYPLILLALFIPLRRYQQIALGVSTTVLITIVSLRYIGPTLPYAVQHLGLGVSGFIQNHGEGLNWRTEGFNHSLFHLIKIAVEPAALQYVLPLYMVVVGVLMTLLYFIRVVRLPFLNQLAVLTIAMAYLPATSYDYTLQVLLLPWAMLALLLVQKRAHELPAPPGTSLAMALFGVIFAPELFMMSGVYCHSGTVKSICLGILLVLVCITPWRDTNMVNHP